MKNYIIFLFLFLITADFNSCTEDSLDIEQQGVLAVEDTYSNADDDEVTAFIAAVYYQVFGSALDAMGWTDYGTGCYSIKTYLDNMGGDLSTYWSYTETSEGSEYELMWSYYYTVIYYCNMIIEYLPDNNVASDDVIEQVTAEARAIRAIMMSYLVQLWGTPPLADHIMTGTEGNTDADESWEFINTELSEVAELLPSKSGTDGQSTIGGRLTKEAVYAYLGRAYLWQKDYDDAADILYNKVIATGLYELNSDFEELNSYTSDFCSEYLWEYELTDDSEYSTSQNGSLVVAFNWTSNAVYYPDEIYDGQGWGTGAFASESFGSFMDSYDVDSDGNEDTRYKGQLATYEDLLDDETRFNYSDENKGVQSSSGVANCEGYFRVRLIPREENTMGSGYWYYTYIHNNFCFMRYSEVLLNYSEAVAEGGTEGSVTGLQALNIVRERAGLDDAPSLDMDNEEYGVKTERRAELFYEGLRFIDLVRWGDAEETLADVGTQSVTFYGYTDDNNDEAQSKDNWDIEYTTTTGTGFEADKNELFPIPEVEINNNPNLVQNQGW